MLVATAVLPSQLQASAARVPAIQSVSLPRLVKAAITHRLRTQQVATLPAQVESCISGSGLASTNQATFTPDCVASISPQEAFNPIGTQHKVTFTCGNSAGLLSFPTSGTQAAIPAGCYDVKAALVDITTGNAASFNSATCGNIGVASTTSTVDCGAVQNPICSVGFSFGFGRSVPDEHVSSWLYLFRHCLSGSSKREWCVSVSVNGSDQCWRKRRLLRRVIERHRHVRESGRADVQLEFAARLFCRGVGIRGHDLNWHVSVRHDARSQCPNFPHGTDGRSGFNRMPILGAGRKEVYRGDPSINYPRRYMLLGA